MFNSSTIVALAGNVRVLGEEALTESLIELQMFKNSTNVK
jgi:hypothetical protein